MAKEYVKPQTIRIGRSAESEQLYVLEEQRDRLFKRAAQEAAKVRGESPDDFYTHTLPQALYDFLDGWDHKAAVLACEAFLEMMTAKKGA